MSPPVFAEYDGEYVLFNTMRGRQKERNVSDNPNVGVSVTDQDNPFHYPSISGKVADVTERERLSTSTTSPSASWTPRSIHTSTRSRTHM